MTPLLRPSGIPQVCFVEDVLRAMRWSKRTFYKALRSGRWPLVESPRVDRRRRFSGESVEECARLSQFDRRFLRRMGGVR